jgi:hypothetical protein
MVVQQQHSELQPTVVEVEVVEILHTTLEPQMLLLLVLLEQV